MRVHIITMIIMLGIMEKEPENEESNLIIKWFKEENECGDGWLLIISRDQGWGAHCGGNQNITLNLQNFLITN